MNKSPSPLVAPWRIGVDVGGTFTDMVLRDADGAVRIFKAPSVPADPSEGVLGVLRLAAEQLDLPLSALLRECALFVHGSTVATNTILEKKGAKVGMLTTEGFRDSLEIRRGIRENQWDHRAPFPPVLAPRYLRLPVRGRIGADGKELSPLAAADVEAAAEIFTAEGVELVAVCLFNSYLDGAHERRAGDQLAKGWAGKWISLSSEVMPTMGEYERGSTAVVNAYVAPKVTSYLGALDQQLRQLGLPRSLLLLQSNGGAVSVGQVANRPVMLVLSGPAAGVGALKGCASPGEAANLISMEIGGTSCDVMVMARGEVPVADELVIDGYHLTTPSVEIHTVGAGGGTIAWVDDAGLLHVGPQGAGARPGPAAYGLGGDQPTVTDAQLVLGRLRPGPLAGGAVSLDGDAGAPGDREQARQAPRPVGRGGGRGRDPPAGAEPAARGGAAQHRARAQSRDLHPGRGRRRRADARHRRGPRAGLPSGAAAARRRRLLRARHAAIRRTAGLSAGLPGRSRQGRPRRP